ncbi:MAG TPA: hypothetical protein VF290_23180 [Pyrinomonadaceae bacterium]
MIIFLRFVASFDVLFLFANNFVGHFGKSPADLDKSLSVQFLASLVDRVSTVTR